jgi:SPP1 gp7 family putative phage head morphogenesis protein
MTKIFRLQSKKVQSAMSKKLAVSDIKKWLLDPKEELKVAKKVFIPLAGVIIEDASADAFKLVGQDDKIDVDNPVAREFLETNTVKFSDVVTEETNRQLGKTLADGVKDGEGIPELKKRVSDLFVGIEDYRSERIARSEVIRATNWATEQAYIDSKVVDGKAWLTAQDERVCPWCGPMDGREIPLKENFFDEGDVITGSDGTGTIADYESIAHPPLHPNCRCTIIPIIK